MTLKAVIALMLPFSPNSTDFQADYITVVEDRPIMSVRYCLPVPVCTFGQNYNAVCSAVSLARLPGDNRKPCCPLGEMSTCMSMWKFGIPLRCCFVSEPQCVTATDVENRAKFHTFWHLLYNLGEKCAKCLRFWVNFTSSTGPNLWYTFDRSSLGCPGESGC